MRYRWKLAFATLLLIVGVTSDADLARGPHLLALLDGGGEQSTP